MKWIISIYSVFLTIHSVAQVDTTFIYNLNTAFGPLDIRISKAANQHYFLEENKTFSFREENGVRTNTYLDMTDWNSSAYDHGNLREQIGEVKKFVMNYRLLKPDNYDEQYKDGYPLVLMLHGRLERGNCADGNCYHATAEYSPVTNNPAAPTSAASELLNNDYNLVHGGLNYLEAHQLAAGRLPNDPSLPAKSFAGFVVFPQNLNGWDERAVEDAIRLVRLMVKKYNIDENRIYINGVSNGGHGAYEAIKRAPWLFASAIMFSAADDALITSQNLSSRISHIPLWLFQGGVDINPTVKETEGYIRSFRSVGANVRYTLYPQLGHGTWNAAFDEPDFFTWMLGTRNSNIHVFAGNAAICKTTGEGAKLELPQGYASYQWEQNGQIISGADSASYAAMMPGAYRARFSSIKNPTEVDWSSWSAIVQVTEQNPTQAEANQIGTVLLKDLNGYANARLEATGDFAHYYWYKNGVLLDLPGNQDDTLKLATINPSYGKGEYSLRVAGYDNCKSPPSVVKKVIFNDQAQVKLITPANFTAQNLSPSEISLAWTDISGDAAYEIWRRKISATDTTAWIMATLTQINTASFADNHLLPSSNYQYTIRAVSVFERSNYFKEINGEYLSVTTAADTEAPSIPANLIAKQSAVKTIKLSWSPSIDNAAVGGYLISFNDQSITTDSNDTIYSVKDLAINTVYTFKVKAIDLAGNLSGESNGVDVDTYVNGLFYEHSTGAWNDLLSIDWSRPEFTGTVNDFTLQPKTQDDYFNFRFDGYISLVKEGVYQFRISSNDGSKLYLNDSLLVDNDGVHELVTVTSPIQILEAGPQRIMVEFFDYLKGDSLLVEYKGPDTNNEWTYVTAEVLRSSLITDTESNIDKAFNVYVYPNPTYNNNLNIEITSESSLAVSVNILDAMGKRLYEKVSTGTDRVISVDQNQLGILKPGLYIISVTRGRKSIIRKLLVK